MATVATLNTSAATSTTKEKAVRYININVPTGEGKTKQLSGIPLYASNDFHAAIMAAMDRDTDTREERMTAAISLTINDVDGSDLEVAF